MTMRRLRQKAITFFQRLLLSWINHSVRIPRYLRRPAFPDAAMRGRNANVYVQLQRIFPKLWRFLRGSVRRRIEAAQSWTFLEIPAPTSKLPRSMPATDRMENRAPIQCFRAERAGHLLRA